ncbi:hypothetical protein P7C73_g5978, partial [Tremellales sp. Uapishka_1]
MTARSPPLLSLGTLPPNPLAKTFPSSSPSSSTSARFGNVDAINGVPLSPNGLANEMAKVQLKLEGRSLDLIEDRRRSLPIPQKDPHGTLLRFIERLLSNENAEEPRLMAIGYELEALLSMWPNCVKLCIASRPPSWDPSSAPPVTAYLPHDNSMEPSSSRQSFDESHFELDFGLVPGERIRYEITIPVWEEGDGPEEIEGKSPMMRVLVSLPPTYPNSSPPQLQLLGRYLGSFSIDAGLFGDITRTYISSSGVPFTAGDVCVFEGLTHVQLLIQTWYLSKLTHDHASEKEREADRKRGRDGRALENVDFSETLEDDHHDSQPASSQRPSARTTFSYTRDDETTPSTPTPAAITRAEAGFMPAIPITRSDPIVDRKSIFIGHAIRVTDEREVPLVIHELLSDKKIAKAAHPAIFAYRIRKNVGGVAGVIHATDYDDDGESQAGSRLMHLLEILELENVLIVVTRWWGGTRLGADRFKHISQSARDALELGGFLEDKEKDDHEKGRKGRGKK